MKLSRAYKYEGKIGRVEAKEKHSSKIGRAYSLGDMIWEDKLSRVDIEEEKDKLSRAGRKRSGRSGLSMLSRQSEAYSSGRKEKRSELSKR